MWTDNQKAAAPFPPQKEEMDASTLFPESWYRIADKNHFWFQWRLAAFRAQIERLGIAAGAPYTGLEVGCGEGLFTRQIQSFTRWHILGVDINRAALARGNGASAANMYYDVCEKRVSMKDRYDFLFLFDVLEHIEDTGLFMESALYHLKSGGWIFINVPAIPAMMSRYDEAVGHLRRYDKSMLSRTLLSMGVTIREMRYWGLGMLPLLWFRRLISSVQTNDARIVKTGMQPPGTMANRFLCAVMRTECRFVKNPILGTSLMVAATKGPKASLR